MLGVDLDGRPDTFFEKCDFFLEKLNFSVREHMTNPSELLSFIHYFNIPVLHFIFHSRHPCVADECFAFTVAVMTQIQRADHVTVYSLSGNNKSTGTDSKILS